MDPTSSSTVQETARATETEAAEQEPELARHPGPREYVMVAIVLAIATAIEVGWYYLNVPHALFIAALLLLSLLKFTLVVLWFMHLRFDARIFRRLFMTGIVLAIAVYAIVLATFLL
ncbi:MAG TPA: cytochrome C oxidase subunit IV family protein [Actinomycetota bacterium]